MNNNSDLKEIDKQKHRQILKLVTKSFYRELVNYGANDSDVINVSVNLLDNVTGQKKNNAEDEYYNNIYDLAKINDSWNFRGEISYNKITIKPLALEHLNQLSIWLKNPEIGQNFIRYYLLFFIYI